MLSRAVRALLASQGLAAWPWVPCTVSLTPPSTGSASKSTAQAPAALCADQRAVSASRPSTTAEASPGMTFTRKPPCREATRGRAPELSQAAEREGAQRPFSVL